MPRMTMIQALRSAMDVMLARDDNVVIYGQDVGYFGGGGQEIQTLFFSPMTASAGQLTALGTVFGVGCSA